MMAMNLNDNFVDFIKLYQSSRIYANDGINIRCLHISELIANNTILI